MPEPRFEVAREARVALSQEQFEQVRDRGAVVILPSPPEELPDASTYHSLFQCAMVAVRATVRGRYQFTHLSPVEWPTATVSAIAVLRDPAVYDYDPETARLPRMEWADNRAKALAQIKLVQALREWGAISMPVEWYVWACPRCGSVRATRDDKCPSCSPFLGAEWPVRYRVVPAPGETEVPESVATGLPRSVRFCASCGQGSTWDEGVDLGGQGPDGHDRTARCCPFCREPRPGSERPDPAPTRPDPGELGSAG